MTVTQKIEFVQEMAPATGLGAALRTVGLARSTWYYQRSGRTYDEKYRHLRRPLQSIAVEHKYGYRRTTTELEQKYRIKVSRKVVQRLHRRWELQLQRAVRKPKRNRIREIIKGAGKQANLVAQRKRIRPLEVLYTDFTELVYNGGRARLMAIVDHASKVVLGWSLGQTSTVQLALEAWQMAKKTLRRYKPRARVILHHDRDPVYTSHEWVRQLLLKDGVRLSYSLQGAKGNVAMESWNGHFKRDNHSLLVEVDTQEELRVVVRSRLRYYNRRRRHSLLANQTPMAYLRRYLQARRKS